MDESKCSSHGLTRVNTCNWCAQPICNQCIEYSGGRKYCPKCHSKLTKGSFASLIQKDWGDKPKEQIFNIDPALSEEEIKKRKQMLEIKEKGKEIMREK